MRYSFSINHLPHSPCSSSETMTPWTAVISLSLFSIFFFFYCLPVIYFVLTPSLEAVKIQRKSLSRVCVTELSSISNY